MRPRAWRLFGATAMVFGLALARADLLRAEPVRARLVKLATADTTITVAMGPRAPRIVSLEAPGARGWKNRAPDDLPDRAAIGAIGRRLVWQLDPSSSYADKTRIEIVYLANTSGLRLVWRWRARAAYGPIEHDTLIQNLGGEPVRVPLQPSIRFDWRIDPHANLERLWIEKGADTPSSEGTHIDRLLEGAAWEGKSSTYARPRPGTPREMIPFLLVGEPAGARAGWYLGLEFSGNTHITLHRGQDSLGGEAGLDPGSAHDGAEMTVPPGGAFTTPPVFVGTFRGGPDGAGNVLRRWVRATLSNPHTVADTHYPLLVNNSWGRGTAIDEALARRMIVDSAALGLEMFHLDAGWFRAVGDWRPDPNKFPQGIATLADFAHINGIRFGLWVAWGEAGLSKDPQALSVGNEAMRAWLISSPPPGWHPSEPYKGITVDLGVPAAREWASRELERIVTDYHIDMLEHDGYLVAQGSEHSAQPSATAEGADTRVYQDSGYVWVDTAASTDVSYLATRAYYRVYEELRARHPQLLLEICNDGGRMVDFGSAAHGDYFSMTDTYDPLSNRRAFYDASHALPPAMLESYVASWPAPRIENFRYLMRSGMLGWFSLMMDTSDWSARQRADARAQFALYKSALRPLIRAADLYHVSPRPDGVHWDGIEYYSPDQGDGVLYAFRGSAPHESVHRFRMQGVAPAARYALTFHDGSSADTMLTGEMLMRDGIEVRLPKPLSSELVFFRQARRGP